MPNLAELLRQHLATPDKVLYRQWVGGGWRDFSAGDVAALAARWQQSFRDRGFERGDRIAICAKNGVQWAAVDLAALGLGLVSVPLYVNDNPENIAWCIANSDARLVVLENARMLETLNRVLPSPAPPIVCLQLDGGAGAIGVDQWLPAQAPAFEVADLDAGLLATIVYTSGTTGRPKGAKLSHGNILSNVEGILAEVPVFDDDILISVLPLSHMFERTCGYYLALRRGLTVAYARGIQQLPEDLATIRPTILMAVPRVFERFLARIEQTLAGSALRRALFDQTVMLGWLQYKGEANAVQKAAYAVLRKLVADRIMARLGGRLRLTAVGGAAVESRIAHTFIALGLNMIQGYGLTEASPIVTANRVGDPDPTSVGYPLKGLEIRISPNHELLVRGASVMQGYWRNPEATAKVLDAEGWLNTGDQVDFRDGKYYIRGRTKDILVLSNGEKLPPEEAETAILDDAVFEQVMVVGEARPFLVLIAVTRETDEKKLVRRANEQLKTFPRWVRVRRIIIDPEPWTVENGLLTPTMKIKREPILARYRTRIERIYSGSGLVN